MIGLTLAIISALWGLLTFWVFARFADAAALRVVRKRIYARLLEIRLYSEEPSLVWSAQKALLVDNLRFLGLMVKPVLILGIAFALLYSQLDSVYGWGPLEIGHSTTVTVPLESDSQTYELLPPPGIVVETPAVRDLTDRQIVWRIRAMSPVDGNLLVRRPGMNDLSRSIVAGERAFLHYPKSRETLAVDYPKAGVSVGGLTLPWLFWFLIFSTTSACLIALLRRRNA